LRRKEKEITDIKEIESIIQRSQVCRLALVDAGLPYIVPLCFGYKNKMLYFHSAKEGQKIDILRRNRQVCFEFDIDARARSGKTACAWEWPIKVSSVTEQHLLSKTLKKSKRLLISSCGNILKVSLNIPPRPLQKCW
jgi:hypothetical protein